MVKRMDLAVFLNSIPAPLVLLVVLLLVGIESLGVPLPGETAVIIAVLASRNPSSDLEPWMVAVAAATGAVIGDSIGYRLGYVLGNRLLDWLCRRFPRHVNAIRIDYFRHLMSRWGWPVVFFGRWVAILRILCGPLAGISRMHYRRFLAANVAGGVSWATSVTVIIWTLGAAAEAWITRASWIILAIMMGLSLIITFSLDRLMDAKATEFQRAREPGQGTLPEHAAPGLGAETGDQ